MKRTGSDVILRHLTRSPFLPLRLRQSLLEWLRPSGCKLSYEQDVHGLRYRGLPGNLVDNHVYYLGIYESSTLEFMRRCVDRIPEISKKTFLYVGANTGLFTLLGSRMFSECYSFEPYPPVFARLETHVAINNLKNVRLFPFGLGSSEVDLPFTPPRNDNLGVGSFVGAENNGEQLLLRVQTGDSLLRNYPTEIGLVKIDVEGFEPHVLAGLQATIRKYQPIIIMELTRDTKAAFGSLERMTESFPQGYAIRAIKRKISGCKLILLDWACKQDNIVAFPPHLAAIIL